MMRHWFAAADATDAATADATDAIDATAKALMLNVVVV